MAVTRRFGERGPTLAVIAGVRRVQTAGSAAVETDRASLTNGTVRAARWLTAGYGRRRQFRISGAGLLVLVVGAAWLRPLDSDHRYPARPRGSPLQVPATADLTTAGWSGWTLEQRRIRATHARTRFARPTSPRPLLRSTTRGRLQRVPGPRLAGRGRKPRGSPADHTVRCCSRRDH
jgi:hypothetical protein